MEQKNLLKYKFVYFSFNKDHARTVENQLNSAIMNGYEIIGSYRSNLAVIFVLTKPLFSQNSISEKLRNQYR